MPTNFHAAFEGSTLVPLATPKSQLSVRKLNDVTALDLIGSFTGDQPTREFREQIHALSVGGIKKFAVNLSQVSYLDSSGVGALLAALRFIQAAGGKCKFYGAPPQAVYTLKTLNLHRVFDLLDDEAAALASF